MNRLVVSCAVAAFALGGFANPSTAHHSVSASYDTRTEATIDGEVVRFEWTNPHSWLWIDVRNADGSVTRWGLEGMSPNFLGRRGWSKSSLQPGDAVRALFFPMKNGEPGGTLLRVTLPDGTEKVMWNRRADP